MIKTDFGFTKLDAQCVLAVVDKGLSSGKGVRVPGKMCVEAAVAFVMGEHHHDAPDCVDPSLRSFKISLNDHNGWKDKASRGRGLRRIAVAQLGSKGRFNFAKFDTSMQGQISALMAPMFRRKAREVVAALIKAPTKTKATNLGYLENQITAAQDALGNVYDHISEGPGSSLSNWVQSVRDVARAKGKGQKQGLDWANATVAEMMVQACIKQKLPGTKYLYLTTKRGKKMTMKEVEARVAENRKKHGVPFPSSTSSTA